MKNLIGQNIGRYHIIEQLGEGGMATVYKAYDTPMERDVAVKIIRTDQFPPAALERILKRFEREAHTLAKLSHPNIVGLIDYGEYEGVPYLVMVYLPGGTLKEKLGSPVPWAEATCLLLPVLRALAYAHAEGVVHRDVKPSNILLTRAGDPMMTDFGIAKILDAAEGHTLTGTGVGIGTPEYMAPEQGLGKDVDGRADIYALGVVFYEMITGRRPFTAETPMAVIFKHLSDPLPRPKNFIKDLPDAVEKVLYKALAKQPVDRYESMDAFTRALEGVLAKHDKRLAAPSPKKGKAKTMELSEGVTIDVLLPPAPVQKKSGSAFLPKVSILWQKLFMPNYLKFWPYTAVMLGLALLAGVFIVGLPVLFSVRSLAIAVSETPLISKTLELEDTLAPTNAPLWTETAPSTNTLPPSSTPTWTFTPYHTNTPKPSATLTVLPTLPPSPVADILFLQDFEDMNIGDWDNRSSTELKILTENGDHYLHFKGTGSVGYPGIWKINMPATWKNYAFESKLRFYKDGVILCFYENNGSHYQGGLNLTSLWFSDYVTTRKDNQYQSIKSNNYQFLNGKWYTVKIEVINKSVSMYVNNTLVLSAERDTIPFGGIGYITGPGGEFDITNIMVWRIHKDISMNIE